MIPGITKQSVNEKTKTNIKYSFFISAEKISAPQKNTHLLKKWKKNNQTKTNKKNSDGSDFKRCPVSKLMHNIKRDIIFGQYCRLFKCLDKFPVIPV